MAVNVLKTSHSLGHKQFEFVICILQLPFLRPCLLVRLIFLVHPPLHPPLDIFVHKFFYSLGAF